MAEGVIETELAPSVIPLNTPSEATKKSNLDKIGEFVLRRKELFAFCLISGGDLAREIVTQDPFLTPEYLSNQTPQFSEGLMPMLSHGGGIFDAYTASLLTYYGLRIITHPIKEKVPTNVIVAVSSLVGLGAVIANEMGIAGGTPDIADIPAGVLGAMIFSGVMILNKKFIKDCSRAIKELKESKPNSPTDTKLTLTRTPH